MALETVGARLTLKERRQFSADAAKAKRDIHELGDEADKAGRKAASAGGYQGGGFGILKRGIGIAATAAKTGIVALAGLTAAAVTLGIKSRASMEQAEIGFATMLGSADKAKSFMLDLRSFAEKTPFQLPDVVAGAQHLLAYGFAAEQILPTLTAIGDASAALGLGAEGIDRITTAVGQIKAKGTVQAEEMRQLAEAGIPAWDILAKKLGVTIPEAMSRVQTRAVSSSVGIAALTEGINQRFGGLMEKQSHTIAGIWSNIVDKVRNGLADMVLPFEDDLKKAESKILDFADRVFTKFPEIAGRVKEQMPGIWDSLKGGDAAGVAQGIDAIFGGTGKLIPILQQLVQAGVDLWVLFRDGIGPAFADVGSMIPLSTFQLAADLLGFMADHAEGLEPLIVGLIIAWATFKTVMFGANTVIAINNVLFGTHGIVTTLATAKTILFGEATAGAATAQWGLNAAMLANPTFLLVVGLAAVVAGLIWAYFHFDRFRKAVDGVFGWVKRSVGKNIGWIVDQVTALPGRLEDAASGLWDWITRGAKNAVNSAISVLNAGIDALDRFEIHISAPGLTVAGHDIIPDWSYDWNGLGISQIPMLGAGGLVHARPGGVVVRVAERARDELVIPTGPAPQVTPLDRLNLASLTGGASGGQPQTIRVPVYLNGRQITEAVIEGVQDKKARR